MREKMKKTLWTKNFTLLMIATALGAVGGIAGSFALSFLVFDETGSTLAAALVVAIQLVPGLLVPVLIAPWMDRLPRKPFLVAGDALAGVLYALAGLYLLRFRFSYVGYLGFSLLLAMLGAFDELAYNSIFPNLIPEGLEEKGYAVSATLYPVLRTLLLPLSAVLFTHLGVAIILLGQGALSILAAVVESGIRMQERSRMEQKRYSLRLWRQDIREALRYLRQERGLRSLYGYMAVTSGVATGYSPMLVAFFRTMPGLTATMYSFFSVGEFLGRSLGGLTQYHVQIPKKKKFGVAFLIYQIYEAMDMLLLWLPYPAMLVNRALVGYLGTNSATLREAAVQRYIPDAMRARVLALYTMAATASAAVFSLLIGALGEILDYRICVTLFAGVTMAACWALVWRGRREIRKIYLYGDEEALPREEAGR